MSLIIKVFDFTGPGPHKSEQDPISVKLTSKSLSTLKEEVRKVIKGKAEEFVICNSVREVIDENNCKLIADGGTYLILNYLGQDLPAQISEKVNIEPHYDTLVKSGSYEYYASGGKEALPYAFAELIDNSLGATTKNDGKRNISVQLYLDEEKTINSVVVIRDNGCGMTPEELGNWAKYKYSKFARNQGLSSPSEENGSENVPRYLNSQISYFGAGGKQAVFYMGSSVRMITKSKNSKDVRELTLSQKEFERKEKLGESIFEEKILSRRVGDASHVAGSTASDQVLRSIINDENEKDSFTCVTIFNIDPKHIASLKRNLEQHVRQLAHIYHYYIHGPEGNVVKKNKTNKLDIVVSLFDINVKRNPSMDLTDAQYFVNLRDVEDDMQTQYIRSAADSFEFRAEVDSKVVEGVVRYHPFLCDHETLPSDSYQTAPEEDENLNEHEKDAEEKKPKDRPIFECFWNGRLIPYTFVNSLEFCIPKRSTVPPECYARISGVLFTDSQFIVTQNKLTFQDSIADILRCQSTIYTHFVGAQRKRGINEPFVKWLQTCHEKYDKEIRFFRFQNLTSRTDLPKTRQYPWSAFDAIDWAGREFKKDMLVKTKKTVPISVGKLQRFLIYGDYSDSQEVYRTVGFFELQLEPEVLHGKTVFNLCKLDVSATQSQVHEALANEESKLPHCLKVTWPRSESIVDGSEVKAGTEIKDIKVVILDRDGKALKGKLPGSTKKTLCVSLLLEHESNLICTRYAEITKWGYWFKPIGPCKALGEYTLKLWAHLPESEALTNELLQLPSYTIKFKVVEADVTKFIIKDAISPQRIGVPFDIPVTLLDKFGNEVRKGPNYSVTFSCSSLSIESGDLEYVNNGFVIRRVTALGKLPNEIGKEYSIVIAVDGIENPVSEKIFFKAGKPAKLDIIPRADDAIQVIENGTLPRFGALICDLVDNPVTHLVEVNLSIACRFVRYKEDNVEESLPGTYLLDFVTGPDGKECSLKGTPAAIDLKTLSQGKDETITARLNVENYDLPFVERKIKVVPSSKPTAIKLFCSSEFDESILIEIPSLMEWTAGSTVKNIRYHIFDEAGNEVHERNVSQSKLKISWTSYGELSKADIKNGFLPDIKVSPSTEQHQSFNVNLIFPDTGVAASLVQQQNYVSFDFTVNARPGEKTQLRVTLPSQCNKVPAGGVLQNDIEVKVADKYCNGVSGITELDCCKLKLTCDSGDIDDTSVEKVLGDKEGVILIKKLKFKDTNLGIRRILLEYEGLKETISIESVAGPPKKLIWEFNTDFNRNVINICKGNFLNIAVQLYDNYGNKCPIPGTVVNLGKKSRLIVDSGLTATTDDSGRANFGEKLISVKPEEEPGPCPVSSCSTKCYGLEVLGARCLCDGSQIMSSVQFHILCDKSRAKKFKIGHSDPLSAVAGGPFPFFSISMLADDESIITDLGMTQLSMVLTNLNLATAERIAFLATRYEDGNYEFDVPEAPRVAGDYNIQFIFSSGDQQVLSSEILKFSVKSDKPSRFTPTNPPDANSRIFVSNTSAANSRIIVRGLKFLLMDQYCNNIKVTSENSQEFDGVLRVDIVPSSNEEEERVPKFEGDKTVLTFDIKNGETVVTAVMLEENTSGVDGSEYGLRFRAKFENYHEIEDHVIKFSFINNVQKQFEMLELDKRKIELTRLAKEKQDKIAEEKRFYEDLMTKFSQAKANEQQAFLALVREIGYNRSDKTRICEPNEIKRKLQAQIRLLNEMEAKEKDRPFRECELQEAPNEPGIIGKIAHLALVSDPVESLILSWHMQEDMDNIVTQNNMKAKELYDRFRGAQQLLSLEKISKRNVPNEWEGPLPHHRAREFPSNFVITGRPVYARTLLNFTKHPEACKIVFGMLLGDTLIMDTMEDALRYEEELIKYTACPTILTRTGERIRDNGRIGGGLNKAPSSQDKLQNGYFGLTPSQQLVNLKREVELLTTLNASCNQRKDAERAVHQNESVVRQALVSLEADHQALKKVLGEIEEKIRKLSQTRGLKRSSSSPTGSLHRNEDKRRR